MDSLAHRARKEVREVALLSAHGPNRWRTYRELQRVMAQIWIAGYQAKEREKAQ